MMKEKKPGLIAVMIPALLIISSVALTACSGNQSQTKPANSAPAIGSQNNSAKLESLPVLKIAAEDWTYVAEKNGWLKEAFQDNGIKVELVQGTLGNEAQLMDRGDLHFANRMLYPYLLYRSQGANLTGVEVSVHPDPDIASVIVPADSPVKTFDDLKGKKIASWKAGCPYMVLYEIAENKGWKEGTDWKYVNIPSSENKTVLLSKEVDAISAHLLGEVAALIQSGAAREIANPAKDSVYVQGGGVTVTFTSASFAANYPNITKKYVEVKLKTQAWMLQNLDEAAKIVEAKNRVPASISKFAWDRMSSTWKDETNLAKIETETKAMQDWLVQHGDIKADKQVDVKKLFDPQFFK